MLQYPILSFLACAATLNAEPTKFTVFNNSGIDTYIIIQRGKQQSSFPVPKADGNVVTGPLAKDKSDRVFMVYKTDKTSTDISNPAVLLGVGSVSVTAIPDDELAVYLVKSDQPNKVDIIFWAVGKAGYKIVPTQTLKPGFDQKIPVDRMKAAKKGAVALDSVGP